MSPYKSSNSLQNSVYSYSFSKQGRFGNYKKGADSLYVLPDTISQKYTTLGVGSKMEFHNPGGKGSPGPNVYNLKSCFENSGERKKGAIFLEKFSPMVILICNYNFIYFFLCGF